MFIARNFVLCQTLVDTFVDSMDSTCDDYDYDCDVSYDNADC
jgi:hypothetical protein